MCVAIAASRDSSLYSALRKGQNISCEVYYDLLRVVVSEDFFDASAIHAATVANFSSCDQGTPTVRPNSLTRRISAAGCIRSATLARSNNSFSLT
jgi:hypothetical protein